MTLPPLEELQRLQANHTPGPWHAHLDPEDADMTYIYSDNGNMCLALCPIGAGSSHRPDDLALAALAPSLLAGVIRIHEAADWLNERSDARHHARATSRVSCDYSDGFTDGLDYALTYLTQILGGEA